MHLIDSQMGFIKKKYMLKVVATMWLSIGKNILKIERLLALFSIQCSSSQVPAVRTPLSLLSVAETKMEKTDARVRASS